MKTCNKAALVLAPMALMLAMGGAWAAEEDGNWKRGRVYYRMVCTDCHKAEMGKTISPNEKTIAEWKAFMDADKHGAAAKANPKVSYYTSKAYRESVKDSNKAAAKLIDLSDQELWADVRAFMVHGAKDSDTPSSCQ